MKTCKQCGEFKPLTEFNKAKGNRDGLTTKCKTCLHEYWKAWYSRPEVQARSRNSERNATYRLTPLGQQNELRKRLSKYDLTEEQFESLWSRSGGLCEICRTAPAHHIDHCHTTGEVRGLLCRQHNMALGAFGDSPEMLRSALSYLTR